MSSELSTNMQYTGLVTSFSVPDMYPEAKLMNLSCKPLLRQPNNLCHLVFE
jgi:hypothetical protein